MSVATTAAIIASNNAMMVAANSSGSGGNLHVDVLFIKLSIICGLIGMVTGAVYGWKSTFYNKLGDSILLGLLGGMGGGCVPAIIGGILYGIYFLFTA